MADNKYRYPPAPASGRGTFSDRLVGLQIVDGGGLTQSNFEFSTNVVEKSNRNFDLGVFSEPISLKDLEITNIEEAKKIIAKDLNVYPNYDISKVTSFSLYGSLSKRISSSITKIINFFPAAIQVDRVYYDLSTGNTAYNIVYDDVEGTTTFELNVNRLKNPFDIDYSVNADRNLSVRPMEVSELRNFKKNYLKYSLFLDNVTKEYKVLDLEPSLTLSAGTIEIIVEGNPFSGDTETTKTLVLKPNTFVTDKEFKDNFDEVEDFLLNRLISPKYTAVFEVIRETNNGTFYKTNEKIKWSLDGEWNLDIRTKKYDNYLHI